jgi:hypothetical protein
MSATSQGFGAALKNEAAEILRITDAKGPITLVCQHVDEDGDEVVLSVSRKSDGALVALAEDTAVSGEDTGYDGNAALLDFTGQSLDELPIVPGSVTIIPTAGGNSVNATDRDGDGKLYTADNDEDECGSIDYFTGALVLHYPAGKAPNTTNILADYTYGVSTVKLGQKNYYIGNLVPGENYESLIIKAAGKLASRVRIEAFQSSVG